MFAYLILIAYIFGASLIPIFGPPSWVFLVYFKLKYNLNFGLALVLGAFATASGRYLLAWITRWGRRFIPRRYLHNLESARDSLSQHKRSTWVLISLFLLSPLPSAQLFEAAGLMNIRLLPLAAVFFAGRLVTYTFYLSISTLTLSNVNGAWRLDLDSPLAIAAQLAGILTIILIANYHWTAKTFSRLRHRT